MSKLAGSIAQTIVLDYGAEELLRRLSDPWWFQAFGCALGFDWHSSGLTTVTCGALKDAYRRLGDELGIVVAGGKGATSLKTPRELEAAAERWSLPGDQGSDLVRTSRLVAKVDSAAVQDGFQLYHHTFMFVPGLVDLSEEAGSAPPWCVVQQGMDQRWARRYHWLGDEVVDLVNEPHSGLGASSHGRAEVLNLVAREARACREASAQLVLFEDPDHLVNELERLTEGPTLFAPDHHPVLPCDVDLPRLRGIVMRAHEAQPGDFQALLGTEGVGPATIRALSLLAELIHGAPPSRRDLRPRRWADMSYAHGGKDGFPYPVDRGTYDQSIGVLREAVSRADAGQRDKADALRRLAHLGGAAVLPRVVVPERRKRPQAAPSGRAPAQREPASERAKPKRSKQPRQLGLF